MILCRNKSNNMKGVWLENKKLTLRDDLEVPKPSGNEVLVKVLQSGICGTDLELEKGYYPYCGVLGHEFVGRVIDENAPARLKGAIVVGEINCVCHKCKFCSMGLKRHCSDRTVMGIVNRWGVHAEYVVLPQDNLLVVPDNVSMKDACFVEPLAAALEIQEQLVPNPTDRVAVIGDGKLGLLIAKSLKLAYNELHVYGRHAEKLALLKEDGIKTAAGIADGDFGTFDVVVECTGNESALEQAVQLLRPRGTLVLKSTHEGKTAINMAPIVVNELTLIGSRCGPFDKALKCLEEKQINLDGLLHREFPLSKALEAFEYAKKKGVLKVQLVMGDD